MNSKLKLFDRAISFELLGNDCALIIRNNGGIEVIVPKQDTDDLVHDASLILIAVNTLIDHNGIDSVAHDLSLQY